MEEGAASPGSWAPPEAGKGRGQRGQRPNLHVTRGARGASGRETRTGLFTHRLWHLPSGGGGQALPPVPYIPTSLFTVSPTAVPLLEGCSSRDREAVFAVNDSLAAAALDRGPGQEGPPQSCPLHCPSPGRAAIPGPSLSPRPLDVCHHAPGASGFSGSWSESHFGGVTAWLLCPKACGFSAADGRSPPLPSFLDSGSLWPAAQHCTAGPLSELAGTL